jgi:hypothetical protein
LILLVALVPAEGGRWKPPTIIIQELSAVEVVVAVREVSPLLGLPISAILSSVRLWSTPEYETETTRIS